MKKKAVSVICAFVLTACCLPMQAQAKVIEPEIVKTETWTASYFLDYKMDTLYPYFDCQADIYNDGTVKCYYWNTHEWDGFKTVKHTVTPMCMEPICTNSENYKCISEWQKGNAYNTYSFIGFKKGSQTELLGVLAPISKPQTINENKNHLIMSYYPPEYSTGGVFFSNDGWDAPWNSDKLYAVGWTGSNYSFFGYFDYYECYLPDFPVNKKWCTTFTPKVDPVGNYTISYLGHEIHITPELLSGNVIATPQLTEQEEYIKKLEAENAALKAENEKLKTQLSVLSNSKFCDINGDNLVDVADAQLVLKYYTETVAGLTEDPIEVWYTKRNTITG